MSHIADIFGSMVFSDDVMRDRLPREVYRSLHKTIEDGRMLDSTVASVVANAMKDWAVEKGATHYSHWFQPLTGVTAEKHDSFLSPLPNGQVIMEFSAKELIKGEPDASSFPSGGRRSTFEARGYTAWDPTSYAFIKDGILCIPSIFCSYNGDALDKKTPLLRSMELVSRQAMRVLALFGHTGVRRVITMAGPEQEYFLVDKELHDSRLDLKLCGHTLFGAKPPKGQELDDHFFGALKPRVDSFMKSLNEELWKFGVMAKTEHSEAAPAQHELAIIYRTTNTATDHNQLTMELMKKLAPKHGLVCLLHEKPFDRVNGSGKHNNWSLSTNKGVNLFEPGDTPYENAQFLLFLCAVIKAVDEYQDLLRATVAGAGNDYRLGGFEAPPTILSMYLGDELSAILESLELGTDYKGQETHDLTIGVDVLPVLPKDVTDRNRTSPMAFTGNKFEFRMVGSSASIADINIVLNTIMAEELCQFADRLEGAQDFTTELRELIKETIRNHRRIIFNGDGYSPAWEEEAERRGLQNLRTSVEAFPALVAEKNVRLFTRHRIFTAEELALRYEVILENYVKTLGIEARTMIEMANKQIAPAVFAYSRDLADTIRKKRAVLATLDCSYETALLDELSTCLGEMHGAVDSLAQSLAEVCAETDSLRKARLTRENVFAGMQALRRSADRLEELTAENDWPFATYRQLMFEV